MAISFPAEPPVAEPSLAFWAEPSRPNLALSPVTKPPLPFPFYPADTRVPRVSLSVRLTGGATDPWTPLTIDWVNVDLVNADVSIGPC